MKKSNKVLCNLCDSDNFGPGPSGRMAITGLAPRCTKCQSLERHRAIRCIMLLLRESFKFYSLRALQFSEDFSVIGEWFAHHEVSVFNGNNSLDLQKIDRPSASYNFIICNHVLEHVPDDRIALIEMQRVVGDSGLIFLSVPSPHIFETTRDWGYPNWEQHGHFRIYGRDLIDKMRTCLPGSTIAMLDLRDEVTNTSESAFLITRSPNVALVIQKELESYLLHFEKII